MRQPQDRIDSNGLRLPLLLGNPLRRDILSCSKQGGKYSLANAPVPLLEGYPAPRRSRSDHSQSQIVIHRDLNILFRAQIALRSLDRAVPQQELDLFEVAAVLAAEFGTSAAQVMRPEPLDSDLFGALLDHRPDGPVAQALLHLALLRDCPEQLPVFHPPRRSSKR